jgi:ubiquitin-conjugating enzyme E2 variant
MFEIIGYLLCCWLLADFITGIIHWLEDRYDLDKMPLIGGYVQEHIIGPNRLHHVEPLDFLKASFFKRNATSFIPAFTVGFALLFVNPLLSTPFFMAGFGNQVHALAHSKGKVSKFTEVLQKIGIFSSPKQHSVHHTSPYDCNYCPMTDFVNPVLEAFNFWERLEYVIEKVAGIKSIGSKNYPPKV